jgi:hypothetical protein
VLSALSRKPYVISLHECGMLTKRHERWLACSPDGIAIIDRRALGIANESNVVIAAVEIKTSISRTAIDSQLAGMVCDVISCAVGDTAFKKFVPEGHIGQLLHQMLVLRLNHVLYLSATETGIMYVVFATCDQTILEECQHALDKYGRGAVEWAHEDDPVPPSSSDHYVLKSIKSRLAFWKLIDSHVKENTPFPRLNLFWHGCQAFYAKPKGGLDGSAQARAIFRSTTSSFKWEQNIVSQTLTTLTVNAFISCRMTQNEHLLETKENLRALTAFVSH